MRRREGQASLEGITVLSLVAVAGLASFGYLGTGFHRAVAGGGQGHGASVAAASPRAMAVSSMAGALETAARVFTPEAVATLRRTAAATAKVGDDAAIVSVAGESWVVSAVPRYTEYTKHVAHVKSPDMAFQSDELKVLLDEAWDASMARGFLRAPRGRTMLEFTGMDTAQREASRIIYSPDGIVSVYMHGSPDSMSRNAYLLKSTGKHSPVSTQATYQEMKVSSRETQRKNVYGSAVTPERVAARLEREGVPAGTPILLRACSAGGCSSKGLNIAQKLADTTGRPVVAASDIHYRPTGTVDGEKVIKVGIEGDPGMGRWRLFLPQTWHEGLPTGGSIDALTDLRGPHELVLLPDGAFDAITLRGPLSEFAGIQNYGAILTAASKLKPGGKLTIEWNRTDLKRVRNAAVEKYRTQFRSGETAKEVWEGINKRVARLDPLTTIRDLREKGYDARWGSVGRGQIRATITAPGR